MYICLCYGVTDGQVKSLVEDGACSVKDVQKRCLAGTDCGSCLDQLRQTVEKESSLVKPPVVSAQDQK